MDGDKEEKLDPDAVHEACEANAQAEQYERQSREAGPSEAAQRHYFGLSLEAGLKSWRRMSDAVPKVGRLRAETERHAEDLRKRLTAGELSAEEDDRRIQDIMKLDEERAKKIKEYLKRLCSPPIG